MRKPEPHELAGAKAARAYVLRRFHLKNTPFEKEPAEAQQFYISQARALLRAAGRGPKVKSVRKKIDARRVRPIISRARGE